MYTNIQFVEYGYIQQGGHLKIEINFGETESYIYLLHDKAVKHSRLCYYLKVQKHPNATVGCCYSNKSLFPKPVQASHTSAAPAADSEAQTSHILPNCSRISMV